MNKNCVAIFLLLLFDFCYGADKREINSPNGKIKLTVEAKEKLFYSIRFNNEIIVLSSEINLQLQDGTDLSGNLSVKKSKHPIQQFNYYFTRSRKKKKHPGCF